MLLPAHTPQNFRSAVKSFNSQVAALYAPWTPFGESGAIRFPVSKELLMCRRGAVGSLFRSTTLEKMANTLCLGRSEMSHCPLHSNVGTGVLFVRGWMFSVGWLSGGGAGRWHLRREQGGAVGSRHRPLQIEPVDQPLALDVQGYLGRTRRLARERARRPRLMPVIAQRLHPRRNRQHVAEPLVLDDRALVDLREPVVSGVGQGCALGPQLDARNSFTRRSCSVPFIRSTRPLAWLVLAHRLSMFSSNSARPNCV